MPLTDAACRNLKPQAKPYKVTDSEGLFLLVNPNGSRLWRLAFRFGGKQKLLALGAYPTVTLAEARDLRYAARKQLAAGLDPSLVRLKEKSAAEVAAANTFKAVAEEWLKRQETGLSEKHVHRIRRRMEIDVFPAIGKLPVAEIEAPTLLKMVRTVEKRGLGETPRRLLQYCGSVFRFAIVTGRASRNPAADLRGALNALPPTQHRAAIKAAELPTFLEKLRTYDGDPRTRLALRFVLLTFVRTGEARFAT